jgi:DNA-binding transcriptional ArsR family regulator
VLTMRSRWVTHAYMNTRAYEHSVTGGECEARAVDEEAVSRALAALPADAARERLVGIFAALADPTRVRMLLALALEPLCVCDLAEVAGVSQSAVSHQLRTLRLLDLVAWERDGKRAVYRLADDHVRALLEIGLRHASEGGAG